MPIGKNAIKRVENNGYSQVQTSAPDMEDSVVAPAETPAEAPAKEKRAPAKKVQMPKGRKGFVRYELGAELPYWLL